MGFPQKIKLKTGVEGRNGFDLSHPHITTTDYFKLSVTTCFDAVPNSTINYSQKSFMRADPMSVPTFGRAIKQYRMYYVPFRLLQKSFNSFYNNLPHAFDDATMIPSTCRIVGMDTLVKSLNTFSQNGSASSYDYQLSDGTYRVFTPQGRVLYSMLVALGYRLEFTLASNDSYDVSAMRLLALARIYYDYYDQTQYNRLERYKIEQILNSNTSTDLKLSQQNITDIYLFLCNYMTYNMDYFTSAFDKPVGSNSLGQAIDIPDNTLPSTAANAKSKVMDNNTDGTPYIIRGDGGSTEVKSFTQFIDTALHRVTDYVTRNRLAGNRNVQRFLARFGIKPKSEDYNRSVFIGDFSFEMNFGDVMSNADTAGAALGAYAGKGIGGGQSEKMTFTNDEFGTYIVISYLMPKINYYQGLDKQNLNIYRSQFVIPEYDALGVDPVLQSELYLPYKTIPAYTNPNNNAVIKDLTKKIFGYLPRYASWKNKQGIVTGEFLFDSRNAGLDAWHLNRTINPNNWVNTSDVLNIVHSPDFCETFIDCGQYDRAFSNNWDTQNGNEHFYEYNYIDLKVESPMKQLFDNYDFDSDGKEILMNLEGKISNN